MAKPTKSKTGIPKTFSKTKGCRTQCSGRSGKTFDMCVDRCVASKKKTGKKVPKGCPPKKSRSGKKRSK